MTNSSDLTHEALLQSLQKSLSNLEAVRIVASSDEAQGLDALKETIRAGIAALEETSLKRAKRANAKGKYNANY